MGAHLTIDFAHVIGVFFVMRNARQSFGSFVFAVRGVVHASWSSSRSHVRRLALSMSWSSLSARQGIKRRNVWQHSLRMCARCRWSREIRFSRSRVILHRRTHVARTSYSSRVSGVALCHASSSILNASDYVSLCRSQRLQRWVGDQKLWKLFNILNISIFRCK